MMTIGLLLKIQPMILLKIFLRIPSMICLARRVFIQKFVEVRSMIHPARGVYYETYESCKEEQSEFSYDQSEMYLSIFNEDLEKQYHEESDWVKLMEDCFQPLCSHTYDPYELD